MLWTALLLIPILALTRGFGRLKAVLTTPKVALTLLLTGTLIGGNWLIFVLAILDARVLEASLGYFINPLVSLALGMVVLKERPRPLQLIAMAVASLGVLNEVVRFACAVPWLGLALAGSFAVYGLLRKQLAVDAFVGLTVESWLLLPVAVMFLLTLPEGGAFCVVPKTRPCLCWRDRSPCSPCCALRAQQRVLPSAPWASFSTSPRRSSSGWPSGFFGNPSTPPSGGPSG